MFLAAWRRWKRAVNEKLTYHLKVNVATQLFFCTCDPAYLAKFAPTFTRSALFFATQLLRESDKLG